MVAWIIRVNAPYVDFVIVLLSVYNFRRHPVWSADHGLPVRSFTVQLSAETEVGQFDGSVAPQQNVVALDVTMDYIAAA